MINLAGVKTCDDTIEEELEIAGIELVLIGKRERSEVPSEYIGKCNNFIFNRVWSYWVVTGYMPLQYAKEMYENYMDLNIRVAGHCGNPPPEEWCESRDYSQKRKEYVKEYLGKEPSFDAYQKFNAEYLKIKKHGDQFVTNYHIDSQEGLNKFAEIIKKYNIIG